MVAVLVGCLLALAGILPPLLLNVSVPASEQTVAHMIQVSWRLAHHQLFTEFAIPRIVGFMITVCAWLVVLQFSWRQQRMGYVHRVCAIALLFNVAGLGLSLLAQLPATSPAAFWLLRFYWFRLADVMLPLALAMGICPLVTYLCHANRLAGVAVVCIIGMVTLADGVRKNVELLADGRPGADRQSLPTYLKDRKRTGETQR
ncbi:MAG: hypothetical protein GTO62_05485, partial [Planctomycetales bacterium]|nr:hypothetical protein [Planctomycetales bacterium]NIP69820.1 hypothetical protein [Planctomycetales bacterium]